MSTPIIIRDSGNGFFDQFGKTLLETFVRQQQNQLAQQQLKIAQAAQKLREKEFQAQQQQAAAQQGAALAQTGGLASQLAAGDPQAQQVAALLGPGFQQALGGLANANVPSAPAVGAAASFGQQPSPSQPSPISAARAQVQQQAELDRLMSRFKSAMTPEEFGRFEAAISLEQLGVPKEMVDFAIPETAKEAVDRLLVLQRVNEAETAAESDAGAFTILRDRYGIQLGGPAGAQKVLADMVLADRKFAQARQAAAEERPQKIATLERQLRQDFEQSQVTKASQRIASSFSRILKLASKENPTGASDTGLVFAFIQMQDESTVREGERRELQTAASVQDRISRQFGTWRVGTILSDSQRRAIVDAARQLFNAQQVAQQSYTDWVRENATNSGVNPDAVTIDIFGDILERLGPDLARLRINQALGGTP